MIKSQVIVNFDESGALAASLPGTITDWSEVTARAIAERMQELILSGAKTGRIYEHGPEPLPHQASAPGEAPADWTGHLVDSIHAEGNEVHADAEYAAALEFGTLDGRLLPRPFFQRTIDEQWPLALLDLVDEIDDSILRHGAFSRGGVGQRSGKRSSRR